VSSFTRGFRRVIGVRFWIGSSLDLAWGRATHEIGQVVTKVVCGFDGKRPKLLRSLSYPNARVIVVEQWGRLVRFEVKHLELRWARMAAGSWWLVRATTDDLVREMIEVLEVTCAPLYGRRDARNGAIRALTAAKREPSEAA
jgi:putative resolvase